jgi:UDP-GlcNAc:undecaprenyl-phosphate GlcNAc-1-phosphate transferase
MMLATLPVMALGLVDDRLDLPSRYRLILQTLVAVGLSIAGVRFHFFPVEALNHVVTVLWIVGVINAMNCLDCADGAAAGTSAVVLGALACLAVGTSHLAVSQAALAGLGAVAGFLIFNFPPAKVFLGDAGSTFLGLICAILVILAEGASKPWQVPLLPLVLCVPVVDIAWVHVRRYRAGITSIRDLLSSTGKDHLPHRLMARGLSKVACMGVTTLLVALPPLAVYAWTHGQWLGAALALGTLGAFLWRLEENAEVVIRPEDGAAIYQMRQQVVVREPALHVEKART